MSKPILTSRERWFCRLCAGAILPQEAALRAGYPGKSAEKQVSRLLDRPEILEEISRVRGDLPRDLARAGLVRLALGPANDAVELLAEEELPCKEALKRLDLICVSEIRRPRGGGLEIKFFDRIKALEILLESGEAEEGTGGNGSFYQALTQATAAVEHFVKEDGHAV